MARRQIDLDEDTDRILSALAQQYNGNLNEALSDLLHSHEGIEMFIHECEDLASESLLAQKRRSEMGFREGRFTSWDDVKRRNNL